MMSLAPRALFVLLCVSTVGCAGTAMTRESFIRIPDHPPRPNVPADVRGTARDAARVAPEQRFAIMGEVVRRFFRPMMQHARWIDPQPLAHRRTLQSDSLAQPDNDWAIAIVDAARIDRVCPLSEANERCRGLAGGVLRFSPPYAVGSASAAGADSAIVYVRYTPVSAGVRSEIEFFLARRDGEWRVVSKRTMPELIAAAPPPRPSVADPRESAESLAAADRAFAAGAKSKDVATALASMFVSNVVMHTVDGHARGKEAAIRALNQTFQSKDSRANWVPSVAGVSSDGEQGFTAGYITVSNPEGRTFPARYLAYWIRSESGWRVAAYKRSLSSGPDMVGGAPITPELVLPTRALPLGDSVTVRRYADELSLAEHAFSREAGQIGLGPAFEKWGAPDALNLGGPNDVDFLRGPPDIAKSVSAGLTAEVKISWSPEQVIVATTGDLGVSIGTIRIATATTTRDVPFFTVWKRAWPTDPWRYMAE